MNLECNVCGDWPARAGLIGEEDRPGYQCPCCFLPDRDCDGILVEVVLRYPNGEEVQVWDLVKTEEGSSWRVIRIEGRQVHVSGPGPCRSVEIVLPFELELVARG